jgi:hypothetical protein
MRNWRHDGWSIIVTISRGRAFDFLAWYRFLTIDFAVSEKPAAVPLDASQLWVLRRPGTVTPLQMRRLQLEKLGSVRVDDDKLQQTFPGMKPGTSYAINDISIANGMHVGPKLSARFTPRPGEPKEARTAYPTILRLATILA